MNYHRYLLVFILILAIAFFFWFSLAFQDIILGSIDKLDEVVSVYPFAGIVLFWALAIASVMVAFFTSAVLIPPAIVIWGETYTFLLLLLGWMSGAIFAYFISKHLGRKAAAYFIPEEKLIYYEKYISERASFGLVLLFRFALPSEVPSYFLGCCV